MCCGKSRAEWSQFGAGKQPSGKTVLGGGGSAAVLVRASPVNSGVNGTVSVRYTESQAVTVRGPVTGRKYLFSSGSPVQTVDTRDANAILQARFFRRA